jgi:cbb3-type cytochrome oxidase subunit 3
MIEISAIFLSLLIEVYVILLIGVVSWLYFASKKKKNDREAALKLVDQIKHQSEARLSSAGSFLKEKYHLEGKQLKKAIETIDRSEKRFFQRVIDIYLKRDSEALSSLDADFAELIETYKSLTPAITVVKESSEKDEQIELLQTANAQLAQELAITNKTMSDMIAEFGNMFGGGSDNELEQTEVVEKVIAHHQEIVTDEESGDISAEDIDIGIFESEEETVTSEDDIDDILNGIISSDK